MERYIGSDEYTDSEGVGETLYQSYQSLTGRVSSRFDGILMIIFNLEARSRILNARSREPPHFSVRALSTGAGAEMTTPQLLLRETFNLLQVDKPG